MKRLGIHLVQWTYIISLKNLQTTRVMLCNFDNFYLFLVILSLNKSRERWSRCFFFAKRCYKVKSVICFWFPWHCLSTGSNNNSVLCFFLKKTFNLVCFFNFPTKNHMKYNVLYVVVCPFVIVLPLYCLYFFDLRLLVTPLVSSNL